MLEKGGRHADKDAYDSVIEGLPVRKAVNGVGAESDDYGGERSPEHGCYDCPDAVHVNGDFQGESDFCGYDVREDCYDN